MFSLVVPFHSDIERLSDTLRRFHAEGQKRNIQEVLLCHNGRALNPQQLAAVQSLCTEKVRLLSTTDKGIGAGYVLGIEGSTQQYCILSASDLPFGFSDVDEFLKHSQDGKNFESFAIGSKAHPRSLVGDYGLTRKAASLGFKFVRQAVLGVDTPGDSQGSLIVRTDLARQIVPLVRSRDYFFSLELITLAQRRGIRVVELPVVLENHEGDSSVSLVKDGWSMFKRIWELSKRK